MAEFALLVAVFAMIVFGMIDFGKINWQKWSVRNAASHAAKNFEVDPPVFFDIYNNNTTTDLNSDFTYDYTAFLLGREEVVTKFLSTGYLESLYKSDSLYDIAYCDPMLGASSISSGGNCDAAIPTNHRLKLGFLHPGMSVYIDWDETTGTDWEVVHHSSVCSDTFSTCSSPKAGGDTLPGFVTDLSD